MYLFLWRIRRTDNKVYTISLDRRSFAYEMFPDSDKEWRGDNVEDLMAEAQYVVQSFGDSDPYGKIWEHANLVFDVDEDVVKEIRQEGKDEAYTGKGCLFLIMAITILILGAYCFFR